MDNLNNTIAFKGYSKELLDYVSQEQFLREDLYEFFVEQFRIHSDTDYGWRGEFWGKMVRGACSVYKTNRSPRLYRALQNTVLDMLSVQEKDGRVSSRPRDAEFICWDMWGRKYVMLGMLYFYDICKSASLQRKIKKFLSKLANYIISHIGEGKNKKSIFETASIYGGLASCSIISPFVRLYNITENEKYLRFAEYIINSGACSTFNILDAANDDQLMPYQFPERKAYELMSCYNGILDYYEVTKDEKYLSLVTKFVDKLIKTDYTIIGCCGTNTEFLDNSSVNQTQKMESFSQETCVSVTLMDLVKHLYDLTGSVKYLDIIERTALNAYFGAINNEHQTMVKSRGAVWEGDNCYFPPHGSLPFDSYSPLVKYSRGYQIAGFMLMKDGRSYGCCAAIGGLGLGIYSDSLVTASSNTISINMLDTYKTKFVLNGQPISISMKANSFKGNKAAIAVQGNGETFTLRIRVPKWIKNYHLILNNEEITSLPEEGFISINREWNQDKLVLKFVRKLDVISLNDKYALVYGPIVLTSDERYNKENDVVFSSGIKRSSFKEDKNDLFRSNIHLKYCAGDEIYDFVDYAQAGKNYDSDNSTVSVWFDKK